MLKRASLVVLVGLALGACAGTGSLPGASAPAISAPGFRAIGPSLAVAAQPSDADIAAARAAGYRTVVNFRAPGEPGYVDERAAVEAAGMRYVAIPVQGHGATAEHAAALDAVLGASDSGPVLMHCRSGTRATMVWTLWLAKHGGLGADEALARGESAGLSGDARAAVEKVIR